MAFLAACFFDKERTMHIEPGIGRSRSNALRREKNQVIVGLRVNFLKLVRREGGVAPRTGACAIGPQIGATWKAFDRDARIPLLAEKSPYGSVRPYPYRPTKPRGHE